MHWFLFYIKKKTSLISSEEICIFSASVLVAGTWLHVACESLRLRAFYLQVDDEDDLDAKDPTDDDDDDEEDEDEDEA